VVRSSQSTRFPTMIPENRARRTRGGSTSFPRALFVRQRLFCCCYTFDDDLFVAGTSHGDVHSGRRRVSQACKASSPTVLHIFKQSSSSDACMRRKLPCDSGTFVIKRPLPLAARINGITSCGGNRDFRKIWIYTVRAGFCATVGPPDGPFRCCCSSTRDLVVSRDGGIRRGGCVDGLEKVFFMKQYECVAVNTVCRHHQKPWRLSNCDQSCQCPEVTPETSC
jgi:hypothetical protein